MNSEAGRRFGAQTLVCIALCASLLALYAEAAVAKTPGSEYCYRTVCRRVLTIAETLRRLGERRIIEASHYDDWRVDRYNTGTLTSDGETFNARSPARAASANLPDGTEVLVRNPDNGRASHLRINDFGPFLAKREIDVTRRVAEDLGFAEIGITRLELYVIAVPGPGDARYRRNRRILDPRGYLGTVPESAVQAVVANLVRERQRVTLSPTRLGPEALETLTPEAPPATPLIAEQRPLLRVVASQRPARSLQTVAPRLAREIRGAPREIRPAIPRLARLAPKETPAVLVTARTEAPREFAAVAPTLPLVISWGEDESVAAVARRLLTGGLVALGGLVSAAGLLSLKRVRRRKRADAPAEPREQVRSFAAVIGPELSVSGHVTTKRELLILGTLTGSIRAAMIEVAAGAIVDATIDAAEVRILGRVTGTIRADRVVIEDGAVVHGHVVAGRIAVAASAELEASITAAPRIGREVVVSFPPKRRAPLMGSPSVITEPERASA